MTQDPGLHEDMRVGDQAAPQSSGSGGASGNGTTKSAREQSGPASSTSIGEQRRQVSSPHGSKNASEPPPGVSRAGTLPDIEGQAIMERYHQLIDKQGELAVVGDVDNWDPGCG